MEGHPAPPETQTTPGQEGIGPPQGRPDAPAPPAATPEASTAGRALASTLAATLPADQMEVLLNLIIRQDEERRPGPSLASAAPTGNPTPLPAAVSSLQIRFPTVDPTHFREILENRFRPENLIKLSSTFVQTTRRQESIMLGSLTMIPIRDKDGEAAEYKGLAAIMQPFGIYSQALLHFCPDSVERELGHALHLYTDLLCTINRSHTLESLRIFHFTFHRKRIALGVYDPTGWRDRDSDLQQMTLTRRDPPPVAGNKRNFDKAFTKIGENPQAMERCNNWNEGRCQGFCKYKHACKICGGTHPAIEHRDAAQPVAASASAGTTTGSGNNIATSSNAVTVFRPGATRQ